MTCEDPVVSLSKVGRNLPGCGATTTPMCVRIVTSCSRIGTALPYERKTGLVRCARIECARRRRTRLSGLLDVSTAPERASRGRRLAAIVALGSGRDVSRKLVSRLSRLSRAVKRSVARGGQAPARPGRTSRTAAVALCPLWLACPDGLTTRRVGAAAAGTLWGDRVPGRPLLWRFLFLLDQRDGREASKASTSRMSSEGLVFLRQAGTQAGPSDIMIRLVRDERWNVRWRAHTRVLSGWRATPGQTTDR